MVSARSFKSRVTVLFAAAALSGAFCLTLPAPHPVAAHTSPAMEGAELFATRGCTHCHGAEGTGTDQGPSLRELRKHLHAAEIERQIVEGGKAMPAFGDTLDHAQVEALVTFLRAKKWVTVPLHAEAAP